MLIYWFDNFESRNRLVSILHKLVNFSHLGCTAHETWTFEVEAVIFEHGWYLLWVTKSHFLISFLFQALCFKHWGCKSLVDFKYVTNRTFIVNDCLHRLQLGSITSTSNWPLFLWKVLHKLVFSIVLNYELAFLFFKWSNHILIKDSMLFTSGEFRLNVIGKQVKACCYFLLVNGSEKKIAQFNLFFKMLRLICFKRCSKIYTPNWLSKILYLNARITHFLVIYAVSWTILTNLMSKNLFCLLFCFYILDFLITF